MTLDNLLARQAGVISRAQALAAGLSRDTVDHRVKARRWQPLYPGVYLAVDRRPDARAVRGDEVRVRAALLWAGEDAFLCGRAAAWWYGMVDEPPPIVGVSVGRRRRLRRRPGAEVIRRELAAQDRHLHRGLAVTAPALTVLEAAVELGDDGVAFLDGALRGSVRFADVHAAYCRYAGSAGSATAGRLLGAAVERSAEDGAARAARAPARRGRVRLDGRGPGRRAAGRCRVPGRPGRGPRLRLGRAGGPGARRGHRASLDRARRAGLDDRPRHLARSRRAPARRARRHRPARGARPAARWAGSDDPRAGRSAREAVRAPARRWRGR